MDLSADLVLRPVGEHLPDALHPALVYLASLAVGSRSTMMHSLRLTADVLSSGMCDMHSLPWHLLRRPHTNALRSWLQDNRSPATANRVLAAVRGTLKNAWELELIDAENYHRAVAVKNVKATKADGATGRALTDGELRSLISVCIDDGSPAGFRDACIIVLGAFGGLRRAEIVGLDVVDFEIEEQQLMVHGKRQKVRDVPLTDEGLEALLLDWLHLRGTEAGPLFVRIRKGGEMIYTRLSVRSIHDIVERRRKQAGVRAFTSHDLRRTFAGDQLDAGTDLAVVAKLMGHASVQTTAQYDRRGVRARRVAMARRHVPYQRKFG